MQAMTYAIALGLLAIVACLGSAGFFLLRRGDATQPEHGADSARMARVLALRVVLSIVLFGSLLLAWKLGYIQPHEVPLQPR